MNLESDPRQAGNSGGYFCDENWWLSLPKQTSSLWPDCSCHSDSKSQSTNCTGQTLSTSVSLTPHFVVCLCPNPLFFHHILSLALLMTSLWLVFGPEVLVSYHLCWFYWSSFQNLEGPLFPPYRGDQALKLYKLMKPATSGQPVRVAVPFVVNVSKSRPTRSGWSIGGCWPGEEKAEKNEHLLSTLSHCQGVGRTWWPTEETGPVDGACQKTDLA